MALDDQPTGLEGRGNEIPASFFGPDQDERDWKPLPANGKTYRLVTDSNGTVEASSVLLSAADAVDMLAAEVLIHRLAGWRVSVSGEGLGVAISAERGDSRRIVRVEEV